MLASSVFEQKNGDVTKAYYAGLSKRGYNGLLAVALFRAQKRSTAAKSYRPGPGYRGKAYDVKEWSIDQAVIVLSSYNFGFTWGWGIDYHLRAKGDPNHHVLYVDLPTGQCSFHTGNRGTGPQYEGKWNPGDGSKNAILRYCDQAWGHVADPTPEERDAAVQEALFAGGQR